MAILCFLRPSGAFVHLGDDALPVDHAGFLVLASLAAGEVADVAGIAARCDVEVAPLAELAARASALGVDDPPPVGAVIDVPSAPLPSLPADADRLLQCPVPLAAYVVPHGLVTFPAGPSQPVHLDPDQAGVLACFTIPTRARSLEPGRQPGNPLLRDGARRDETVAYLAGHGLLTDDLSVVGGTAWNREGSSRRIDPKVRELVRRQAEVLAARPPRAGRVPVFPVEASARNHAPLALGMLLAAAGAHRSGALQERYDLVPDWQMRKSAVRRAVADGPAVFLFSNYTWSSAANHAISAQVKELSPASVTIHGGPDAPKYPGDREAYFDDHPSVDVIVHGEGETTIVEVLDAIDGRLDGDLSALQDVPGITFRPRPGAAPVTTADRDRISDLDSLPSPYLTGVFDAWPSAAQLAIIETNRGCPYGCTFCDWGSATNARIRQFDLDRVFAELDWIAESRVPTLLIADANFGIFERDVAIAQRVADLKASTGFPKQMFTNYAKNTVKHLEPIVTILSEARLNTAGVMSVQSFDDGVLKITKRKNLKQEEYLRIAERFRANRMPMVTDLMLGLPGSTVASTLSDLQQVVEREVNASIYSTHLLANSPMNEPSYRAEWQIVTHDETKLISTASYTEEDRREMDRIAQAFQAAETHGILRIVLRWLAARLSIQEIDVLEAIRVDAAADVRSYPLVHHVLTQFLDSITPPGPWGFLMDEVARLVEARWDLPAVDPEWVAVRTLQVHVLPDRGRSFPDEVALCHDVPAWLADWLDHRWTGATVAPLADYPPATVRIDDPAGTCLTIGGRRELTGHHSFELAWVGARHFQHHWSD